MTSSRGGQKTKLAGRDDGTEGPDGCEGVGGRTTGSGGRATEEGGDISRWGREGVGKEGGREREEREGKGGGRGYRRRGEGVGEGYGEMWCF